MVVPIQVMPLDVHQFEGESSLRDLAEIDEEEFEMRADRECVELNVSESSNLADEKGWESTQEPQRLSDRKEFQCCRRPANGCSNHPVLHLRAHQQAPDYRE